MEPFFNKLRILAPISSARLTIGNEARPAVVRCLGMQLREVLQRGLKTLLDNHVPSAQLAAELLLMHVLKRDRAYLYAYSEVDLSRAIVDCYLQLIEERSTGKPTQYLTGHQEFWGLDFEVTPDVLIPRPETEGVIEAVNNLARRQSLTKEARLRIVDVGTGSGCIALALASEFPRAVLLGTDISQAALVVASRNAERLGMAERIRFLQGDLLGALLCDSRGLFDFVVSNPPYVGCNELDMVQREVRDFEPRIAWDSLEHGDEIYSRLVPQGQRVLKPGGYLVFEIGYNMTEVVRALLGGDSWTEVEVRPDLRGIPRVISARKVGEQ